MDNQLHGFERQSPGRRLAMLNRLSMAYMAGPLKELGVGRGRIGFLMGLFRSDGVVQEELSHRLCIDPAATARALLDMEKDGLIRREADPDDRRKKRVYLTDKARTLRPGLMEVLARHNEALFDGLSVKERDQFLTMLDRLVSNLRTAVEAPSA